MAEDSDATYQQFTALRAMYSNYTMQVETDRRYYDRDFKNEVLPDATAQRGMMAVIPLTPRRTIDELSDHILSVPKVKVPVRATDSDLVTEQLIAEKKRKAIVAYWRQITQRFNPIGDGRKWLLIDGMIAVQHSIRWDLIPSKDDPKYRSKMKKLGRNEFLWEDKVLNNAWVFIDPDDHRNPQHCYVSYSISKSAAMKRFPDGNAPGAIGEEWRQLQRYDKVNYLEYWTAPTWNDDGSWDPGVHQQFIESDCVHDDINPYPYVPIAVEDSGYGLVHEGVDIEKKFVGLNTQLHSLHVAQARQWTSLQAVTEMTAFNPTIARNLSKDDLANILIEPGAIWPLTGNPATDDDAQMVELMKWPDPPASVLQMIGLIDKEVNDTTKASMLGGIPQRGVDTASEADQNVRNASAKLQGPVGALQRLCAKLTRWFLMDIELVLEAPVTLFGTGNDAPADITLTPKEINGYYDVTVEMSTTDEEALSLTKARFWGEMYRVLPFLSAFTAMEAGGISDDPLGEMLKRAGEDVFLSPEFTQMRVATGAESFGEFAQYIAELVKNQKGGGNTTAPAGPDSAQGLVTQAGDNAPVSPAGPAANGQDPDMMAMIQSAQALRAGRTVGTQPSA